MTSKNASKILGVHYKTLQNWDKKGYIKTIRTSANNRLYNVAEYLKNKINKTEINIINKIKRNICYARVSSVGQKDDLERQKEKLISKYKKYEMIEDIGSGINFNRRGLKKIINLAIKGEINEIVIVYKDRLARFGYDLIEDLIKKYSNGKITIMEKKENLKPEEEMIYDVMQIMNVFIAKMNGLRKYRKNN